MENTRHGVSWEGDAPTWAGTYRLLFFAEAPGMIRPALPVEHHVFAVACETAAAFDLTAPPFDGDRALWIDHTDHAACHAIADRARALGVAAIRYESVRDRGGRCAAILDPAAFAHPEPTRLETWHLFVRANKVQAWREFPPAQREFDMTEFADDPRLASRLGTALPGEGQASGSA